MRATWRRCCRFRLAGQRSGLFTAWRVDYKPDERKALAAECDAKLAAAGLTDKQKNEFRAEYRLLEWQLMPPFVVRKAQHDAGNKTFLGRTGANAAAEPGMMAFVGKAGSEAYASSIELQQVAAGYVPAVSYPNTALGRALQLAAQIITADLGTGVVYVTTGGFDTHSGQPNGHQQLLTQVSDAIAAFTADVEGHRREEKVVLMTWSEFGR